MEYSKPFEVRAGTASLFPNDRKTQPMHPDWKGRIKWHNGSEAWLSAWDKTSKNGLKYLSIEVGDYITQQPSEHEQAKANGYQPQSLDVDNEVPF